LEVCDDNNDGFSCLFVLGTKDAEITGGVAGLVVTYHETATDAQNGVNPINPVFYCNIVAGVQLIYIRVYNSGAPQCASFTTMELHVNPVPVPAVVIQDYELCDVNAPGDGIEGFDLPSMDAAILNGQAGVLVTYYETQADALSATAPINTAVLYTNTTPGLQQIWVRLENAATGCFAVSSFNLVVNPLPGVTAPAPMNACANGNTGTADFNLTLNDAVISGNAPGVAVSYYATLSDAQNELGALASPYTSASGVIFVRVEDIATGCFDTTTLTLNVTQGPVAVTPTPLQVCDPNSDCFSEFDLESASNQIGGGGIPAGVTITYHETLTDAQNGVNPLASPYTNIVACLQTIHVRVSYDLTGCSNFVELQLIVNPTPQATEIPGLEVCDDNTDGIGVFNLSLATAGILTGLNAADHTVSYYETQVNAQAANNPISNVFAYSNTTPNTQVIWVRVEHNTTGCFDVVPLTLTVNPLPSAPSPAAAPYSLCDYNNPGDEIEVFDLGSQVAGILAGQTGVAVTFHETFADAIAGAAPLANLYTNGPNAQTIFVRVENEATGCFVTTTMDLRVEPLPVLLAPPGPVVECDMDEDGITVFDLTALVVDMVQGAPDITVTFHETQTDAQTGATAIPNPAAYTNVVPFAQFIWVRAQNTLTGCYSVIRIELDVVPAPEIPVLDDLTLCDDQGNAQDGFRVFDLTVQTPIILAAQPGPPANYQVGYYTTQALADAGTNPIVNASSYTNQSNPQVIYFRVSDVTGQCYSTGSFSLIVGLPLALITPAPLALCDDGPTTPVPQTVFDLTVKDNEITQNLPGYTVTYYPSYAQALVQSGAISAADQGAYTNLTNPQTLGVVVENAQGCISVITLDIRVLPLPTPQQDPEPLEACDNVLPQGTEIFDLTQNQAYIADGDPNLTFEYYPSEQDALDGTLLIANPTAYEGSGSVWVMVMNAQVDFFGQNCYELVEQVLIVNPLPDVALAVDYTICDPGIAGTAVFTLDSQDANVLLAPQVAADFTITYHISQADALSGANPLPNSYTNAGNPQNIYVHVENNTTGCVSATTVVTLSVAAGAVSASPAAYAVCDTDTDGLLDFDLETLFNPEVLAGQNPALFTVAYFASQADALANTGVLATPGYITGTATLWAVVTNTTTLCRSTPASVSITVEPLANPVITSSGGNSICVEWGTEALLSGLTLFSNLDPADYIFQWFLNGAAITGATGTNHVIDTVAPGAYTVEATSISALACPSGVSQAFDVEQSGPPVQPAYTLSNAFADNQTITVTVQGYGDYLYSLDGGPFLDNGGVFTNVGPGLHDIVIQDGNTISCGSIGINAINVIDYPPYFTPNGDGIHDYWNIIGLDTQPSTKIYIFDRYGKLLKQISSTSPGWDGTYNGQPMPSTDYWFTVFYPEAGTTKEFKAHFSLKR